MKTLRSYLGDRWVEGSGAPQTLVNPATEEPLAQVSSDGLDIAAALEHSRRKGGPALRALGFAERGNLLKEMAKAIQAHRDELLDLAVANGGNTRSDAKFDVDGAIFTLQTYAELGASLGTAKFLIDGEGVQLGRSPRFHGQHVSVPRHGVAVQINAFNFPAWGLAEKAASALLAGMPVLSKPATSSAMVAHRVMEILVEKKVLPEGALSLLVGAPRDLPVLLGAQDVLAFTGSGDTGMRIRGLPNIILESVRVNIEADSLNAAVLGPDADAGGDMYETFLKDVLRDMTQKAGQKCTAIRRAFVPAELLDTVAEAASARLAKVTVGNPSSEGVRMGALASLEQRDEVRRSLKSLRDAGSIVFGDPERVDVVDADAERGAFLSPILLKADPERSEPHEVEAFGPVATLLPYTSTEQVIEFAARGQGSLAGSVVTGDAQFAREVVLGVAPWHGRLLVLDADDAKESTGHGSPMPQLVHGGPGRAGGGEEMGGIRGVLHHMQRTAVQGSPEVLSAITGQWVPGAERTISDVHPFRKSLAELKVGDTVVAGPRTVTLADIDHFAEFTGDTFYAHTDEEAAKANPLFGGIVAHGYLVLSFAAGLFVSPEPGPVLANYGLENLRFLTPVFPGDELTVTLTAKQITPRDNAEYGEVRWDADVTKQDGSSAAKYDVLTLVAKENP